MLALILALSLLLHITDPINDGYGNASLTPPSSIHYRSVNAIDITDFSLNKDSKLGFSISFSDLSNPNNLENGFSLPIIEVYFDDNKSQASSNALLIGSGMQLDSSENWHYAFKISGDFIRLYENSKSGIVDISKLQLLNISRDGNTILISTDLPKKRNLKAYLIAGNYTAFNATGWKEISKQLSPWSYSSKSQTRPVVDLLAENAELQTQAIDSGILPMVSNRANSQVLWRTIMLLGLLLGILGLIANLIAKKKEEVEAPQNNLAERLKAATAIAESPVVADSLDEDEFFSKLDINVNEYEKTMVIKKPPTLDIDINLEEFGETENSQSQIEAAADAADVKSTSAKQTPIFPELAKPGQMPPKPKKNKKINIHNFSDEDKVENKPLEESKTSAEVKEEKIPKNQDTKKSLRVVDTMSSQTTKPINKDIEKANLINESKTEDDEIVFSLGDSFWDDFDKTRNINWKK